jgi:hypothetical protein
VLFQHKINAEFAIKDSSWVKTVNANFQSLDANSMKETDAKFAKITSTMFKEDALYMVAMKKVLLNKAA